MLPAGARRVEQVCLVLKGFNLTSH